MCEGWRRDGHRLPVLPCVPLFSEPAGSDCQHHSWEEPALPRASSWVMETLTQGQCSPSTGLSKFHLTLLSDCGRRWQQGLHAKCCCIPFLLCISNSVFLYEHTDARRCLLLILRKSSSEPVYVKWFSPEVIVHFSVGGPFILDQFFQDFSFITLFCGRS